MTTSRRPPRQSRREAARKAQARTSRTRWVLVAVGAVIVGAGGLAIVLGGGPTGGSFPAISTTPEGPFSPGHSGPTSALPVITGSPLPAFTATSDDPAKGMAAPIVTGTSFSGSPVALQPTGRPTAIIFIAHWCPHCQREVPLIQAWINQGGLPEDLDFVSVATAIDPTRPNYPPDAWLAREGWTVPVLVDPTNGVASAYGLSAFPYWVFLDGDGRVVTRTTGELAINDLQAILTSLTAP